VVEVLYSSTSNTSTDFPMNLSTNYSMVEVVEIVEVLYVLKRWRSMSSSKYIELIPITAVTVNSVI
jgi:hypothetical protein